MVWSAFRTDALREWCRGRVEHHGADCHPLLHVRVRPRSATTVLVVSVRLELTWNQVAQHNIVRLHSCLQSQCVGPGLSRTCRATWYPVSRSYGQRENLKIMAQPSCKQGSLKLVMHRESVQPQKLELHAASACGIVSI